MITKYYYIPKIYEPQLLQAIEAWKYDSPNAYVVVTGNYENESVQEVGFWEYTSIMDMTDNYIPSLQYILSPNFELLKQTLRAFCLKGELPNDLHNLAMSLSGVMAFDSPEDYLNYINNL